MGTQLKVIVFAIAQIYIKILIPKYGFALLKVSLFHIFYMRDSVIQPNHPLRSKLLY